MAPAKSSISALPIEPESISGICGTAHAGALIADSTKASPMPDCIAYSTVRNGLSSDTFSCRGWFTQTKPRRTPRLDRSNTVARPKCLVSVLIKPSRSGIDEIVGADTSHLGVRLPIDTPNSSKPMKRDACR